MTARHHSRAQKESAVCVTSSTSSTLAVDAHMPPKRRAETAAGSGRQRKRARTQQARSIDVERSAQGTASSLSSTTKLTRGTGPGSAAKAGHQPSVDVERLVKVRKTRLNRSFFLRRADRLQTRSYEINALSKSMRTAQCVCCYSRNSRVLMSTVQSCQLATSLSDRSTTSTTACSISQCSATTTTITSEGEEGNCGRCDKEAA